MSVRPVEYWVIGEGDKIHAKGHEFVVMDNAARKFAIETNAPIYLATVNKAYVPEPAVKVVALEDYK